VALSGAGRLEVHSRTYHYVAQSDRLQKAPAILL
jgi:hypothetical protein